MANVFDRLNKAAGISDAPDNTDTDNADNGDQVISGLQQIGQGQTPQEEGSTLGDIGRAIADLPVQIAGSFAAMTEGSDPKAETDWHDKLTEYATALQKRRLQRPGGEKEVLWGITRNDIRELPQNLAYSLNAAVPGIATGLATTTGLTAAGGGTTFPGATVAGYLAGGAASGAAAYKMDRTQFLNTVYDSMKEEAEANGKAFTKDDWEKAMKGGLDELATEHGLYEAIPEAIGNMVDLKIVRTPVGKLAGGFVRKLMGKEAGNKLVEKLGANVASRFLTKMAGLYGTELATETVTQTGQHNVEREAGIESGPERSFTSLSDYIDSFKEIAPQTFLLTTVMGGASYIGSHAYDKMIDAKRKGDLVKGAANEDQLSLVPDSALDSVTEQADQLSQESPADDDLAKSAAKLNQEKARRELVDLLENDQQNENAIIDKEGDYYRALAQIGMNKSDYMQDDGKIDEKAYKQDIEAMAARLQANDEPLTAERLAVRHVNADQAVQMAQEPNAMELAMQQAQQVQKAPEGTMQRMAQDLEEGQQAAAPTETQRRTPPLTEKAAQRRSEYLASQQIPHEIIPHPEVAGRFAVIPQSEQKGGVTPYDRENQDRVPGEKQGGEKPLQGQPEPSRGEEATATGGVLQAPPSGRPEEVAPSQPQPKLEPAQQEEPAPVPAATIQEEPAAFKATHELPDGTQVRQYIENGVEEPGVWQDKNGDVIEDNNATPLISSEVDKAAHEAATSPTNEIKPPSQAQIEAGNYKKGHLKIAGLDVTIENPQGSERSGTDEAGKPWSQKMANHYGYFKRTEGADGDQVDTFIGPNTDSQDVYVVDQNKHDGKFDEHKVMLGFDSVDAARKGYLANYEPGWDGIRSIAHMSATEFKQWLKNGDQNLPAYDWVAKQHQEQRQAATVEKPAAAPAPLDHTIMPDGKHKGTSVYDIAKTDPGYLSWVLSRPNYRKEHKTLVKEIRKAQLQAKQEAVKAEPKKETEKKPAEAAPHKGKDGRPRFAGAVINTLTNSKKETMTADQIASKIKGADHASKVEEVKKALAWYVDHPENTPYVGEHTPAIFDLGNGNYGLHSRNSETAKAWRVAHYPFKPDVVGVSHSSDISEDTPMMKLKRGSNEFMTKDGETRSYMPSTVIVPIDVYNKLPEIWDALTPEQRHDISKDWSSIRPINGHSWSELGEARANVARHYAEYINLKPEKAEEKKTNKAVDEKGQPITVYRGQYGKESGVQSRLGAISFGNEEAARTYAESPNNRNEVVENPRIITANLVIENPVINTPDDPFIDFKQISEALGNKRAEEIAIALSDAIKNTNNWEENYADKYQSVGELLKNNPAALNDLYVDAFRVFDNAKWVGWFRSAGYDGAIHAGNGETALEPEYKVFSKSQINVISETPIAKAEKPAPAKEKPAAPAEPTLSAADKKKAGKLRMMADNMEKQIDEKLNPAISNQNITARRSRIANGMRADGERLQKVQAIMRSMADAIEAGVLPEELSGITTRADIETMMGRSSFPQPVMRIYEKKELLEGVKGIKGIADDVKTVSRMRIMEKPRTLSADEALAVDRLLKAADKDGRDVMKYSTVRTFIKEFKRVEKAGITTEGQFERAQALLNQYAESGGLTEEQKRAKHIRELEVGLLGNKIAGFFPTPQAASERMVDLADVEPGMSILEPEAGAGHLADVIRDTTGITPDVIEVNPTLRELLEAKGYKPIAWNMLEYSGKKYDRIIMNPPFEKGQDIDHVTHAYNNLLKPGGTMVSVMSESTFFRDTKKQSDFREWLDEVGAHVEDLEAGTFNDAKLIKRTGVKSRIVTIQKPEEAVGRFHKDIKESLSTLHNLTPDNLAYADKMGGFAVPSIAVVRGDMGLGGYGEITLIGTKDLGDPNKVEIHDSDSYSSTFPVPEYKKAKVADVQALLDAMRPYAEKMEGTNHSSAMSEAWDYLYTATKIDPERAISAMVRSNGVKEWFLEETTGKGSRPVTRDARPRNPISFDPKVREFFKNADLEAEKLGIEDPRRIQLYKDAGAVAREAIHDYLYDIYSKLDKAKKGEPSVEELIQTDSMMEPGNSYTDKEGKIYLNTFHELWNDQAKYGTRVIDKYATEERLDKKLKGKEAQFQAWVTNKVLSMMGEPRLTIGGRKLAYNLENIVEYMTRNGTHAQEDTMVFGPGKARAVAAKKMGDLTEMRNSAQWQLGSEAEIEASRKDAEKKTTDFREAVVEYYTEKDWDGDIDRWAGFDSSMKALATWARTRLKYGSEKAMRRALSANGFSGVPSKIIDMGIEAGDAVMEAPVPYFEAKPHRAVTLDEFAGAVVPNKTSKETLAILDKHGIKWAKYGERFDEEARTKAVIKLRDQLSKTREVLFHKAPLPEGTKAKVSSVDDEIQPLIKQMPGAPKAHVVPTSYDLPKAAVDELEETNSDFSMVRGWFDNTSKEIYLVADNMAAEGDATETFLHEVVGHYGLRSIMGDKLDPLMRQVFLSNVNEIRDLVKRAYPELDLKTDFGRRVAAEEYIAYQAQTGKQPTLWQKVVSAIKEALRHFTDLEYTETDIAALIGRSRRFVSEGNRRAAPSAITSVQSPSDPYGVVDYEKRPGATMDDQLMADELMADLEKRRAEHKPSLLGSAIPKEFKEESKAKLIGQTVKNGMDLALLSQIYRNPHYETLRVFIMKGDQVVGQTGVTSRLPSSTASFVGKDGLDNEENFAELERQINNLGGDGYFLLHNHPSGNPSPSIGDVNATRKFASSVPGFIAHIVINSNSFGMIYADPGGRLMTDIREEAMPHTYSMDTPVKPHKVLGMIIKNQNQLAQVSKEVQVGRDYLGLIAIDPMNKVRGIMEVHADSFDNIKSIQEIARNFAVQTGGQQLFITQVPNNYLRHRIESAIHLNIFTDAITTDGESIRQQKPELIPTHGLIFGEQMIGEIAEEKGSPYNAAADIINSMPEETRTRIEDARKGLADQRTLREKIRDWGTEIKEGFTRHYQNLPVIPEYAQALEALRQMEAAPQASKDAAERILDKITRGMNPADYELFSLKVLLDDLAYEDSIGHDLPFALDHESLTQAKRRTDEAVANNDLVRQRLKTRKDEIDKITAGLVNRGVLSAETLKNPAYFRHQVLTYARMQQIAAGSSKVKKPKPGYAKHRAGSLEDINANYIEAEFEFMQRAMVDMKMIDTIERIRANYDKLPEIKKQAKDAGMGRNDWRTIIPSGYRIWQPEKGNVWYRGQTVSEQALDHFLDMVVDVASQDEILPQDITLTAAEMLQGIRTGLMMGGKKRELVLPEALADTMDNMRELTEEGVFDKVLAVPLRHWKRWVLINPRRVIKYNLNNLSGDMDAAIAANPHMLSRLPEAIKELWSVMHGADPSPRYLEAVERGVFDSGLSIQEIPDINALDKYGRLTQTKEVKGLKDWAGSIAYKVWNGLQDFTRFRENWMRYAAYLDYADRLAGGENLAEVGWGASNPEMVETLLKSDYRDAAGILAREAIGDYGNVSAYGMQIRNKLIPFYSWLEINTSRYTRLFRNAWGQGIGSTGRVGAVLTTSLLVRMAFLYGAVQLFNNLFFGDDEDDLDVTERMRLHINLGKDSDGKVRSIKFQGALSDYLAWFGFENAVAAMTEIDKGRASWGDVMTAILKAPINKVVGGVTPVIRTPVELLSGQSFWPDVFNPRPMSDRKREAVRLFSLENEYDWLTGAPTRGYARSWTGAIIYRRDPGEIAYNRIKGLVHDWNRKVKGIEGSSTFQTPRSVALRNYKIALRYGDQAAAKRYRRELAQMGVTWKDLGRSIENAHPLGTIAKKDRIRFLHTLTPKEREMLSKAISWYREVYR